MKLTDEQRLEMEAELAVLRADVATLNRAVMLLDVELEPMWTRKNELEAAIRATHNETTYVPWRSANRAPLYDGLLELAVKYGARKAIRTETVRRMGGYDREARALQKLLDKDAGKSTPINLQN